MHLLAASVLPLKSTEASLRTTPSGLVLLGFIYVKLETHRQKLEGLATRRRRERDHHSSIILLP
jgi:hypothetical protein